MKKADNLLEEKGDNLFCQWYYVLTPVWLNFDSNLVLVRKVWREQVVVLKTKYSPKLLSVIFCETYSAFLIPAPPKKKSKTKKQKKQDTPQSEGKTF